MPADGGREESGLGDGHGCHGSQPRIGGHFGKSISEAARVFHRAALQIDVGVANGLLAGQRVNDPIPDGAGTNVVGQEPKVDWVRVIGIELDAGRLAAVKTDSGTVIMVGAAGEKQGENDIAGLVRDIGNAHSGLRRGDRARNDHASLRNRIRQDGVGDHAAVCPSEAAAAVAVGVAQQHVEVEGDGRCLIGDAGCNEIVRHIHAAISVRFERQGAGHAGSGALVLSEQGDVQACLG